ncbi:hypothetical protein IEQ34_011862 [Dendrobium chrysotoxum]|uniref:Uncharacterized protein n=1 Tax=Dendrobium chrysotoxum TaxID=161865 RepID=A0AAV7GTV1_DENCH|nr:hypothetical protein IEQ34_011862 [Dendrobium chrysotoxum]
MASGESSIFPWINFFPISLPPFFSPCILHGLGSLFGRPIQMDNATATGSKPSVAHILVELDITKNYPNSSWLGPEKYDYIQKLFAWCLLLEALYGLWAAVLIVLLSVLLYFWLCSYLYMCWKLFVGCLLVLH